MATATGIGWADLGKKRLEVCAQVKSAEDWKRLWSDPPHEFPFEYGTCWNFCTEYRVANFEAEVGFFTDGLCLDSYVLQPDYAMFTDPEKSFYFAFVPAGETPATGGGCLRLAFLINNIVATIADLESRGIAMTAPAAGPWPGSPMLKATFETPNGIQIDLWGMTDKG
jgi:hypothetical protein